jgi:hypothetical protein
MVRQRLHGVYGDRMIVVNRSDKPSDSWMRFWLYLLLLQSQTRQTVELILASGGENGTSVSEFQFRLPEMADQTAQQTAKILLSRMLGLYRLMRQFRVHGFISIARALHGKAPAIAAELPALPEEFRGSANEPLIADGKGAHPACFARWWADGPPWNAPPEQAWVHAAAMVWEDTGGFGGPTPEHTRPWGRFVFGDSSPWAGDEEETRINATLGAWLVDVWCPFIGSLTAVMAADAEGDGEDA